MSIPAPAFLSSQSVAEILGVGVSTVKRLVDTGRLPSHVTTGKHRRIEAGAVLRLVDSGNFPAADRDALRRHSLAIPLDADALSARLFDALTAGDADVARTLLCGAHEAGRSVAWLADMVIAPTMREIGHGWETKRLDVYQEHEASQACQIAVQGLRQRVRARGAAGGPVCVGGGPEGDHYCLANQLIALMLADVGWRVAHVGPNTPLSEFAKLIERTSPRLMWLSCSHLSDVEAFVEEFATLKRTAERHGVRIAVGGNALTEAVRRRIAFEHHGDTLAHLETFARSLQ